MYYLLTEYELPILGCKSGRKLITIGNKTDFADMYDYHPLVLPIENKKYIMPKESLEQFIKNGFATKEKAENANKIKKAIVDFIGFFFNGSFEVVSETELLEKYKTL